MATFERGDRVRVNDRLANNPIPAWSQRVGREGIVLGSQPDPAVDGHTTIVHLDGDPYGDVVWFRKGTLDLVAASVRDALVARYLEARAVHVGVPDDETLDYDSTADAESAGFTAGMRAALDELGWLPPEDTTSSVSRQHYIDTGVYLHPGEAEEG